MQSERLRPLSQGDIDTLPYGNEIISFRSHRPEHVTPTIKKLLYFPGLGDYLTPTDLGLDTVAELGVWVVKFAEPHGPGRLHIPDWTRDVNEEAVEAALLVKKKVFGSGKVDFVGPSRGGAIAVEAAFRNPEHVQSLTLINPAICLPEDTPFTLISRYGANGLTSYRKGTSFERDGTIEVGKQVLSAPRKSFVRGFSLIGMDIPSKIVSLTKQDIPVSIIFGREDTLFPPENTKSLIQEHALIRDAASPEGVVVFDGVTYDRGVVTVIHVNGGHYLGDEPAEYGRLIVDTISKMRGKLFDTAGEI